MIFLLNDTLQFPNPLDADEDGLLAIGGDLSIQRLTLAYSNGIFPWFEEEGAIFWYATQPRFVLYPSEFHSSKSFKKFLSNHSYRITINTAFEEVISMCKTISRKNESSTWISERFKEAYTAMHNEGLATSVEVWNENNKLVGGLYGVTLHNIFYGESMFHKESNTSKLALYHVCKEITPKLIDCQMYSDHLASLGARMIPMKRFLEEIQPE